MQKSIPEVKNERFNLIDSNKYIVCGLWIKDAECYAEINGKPIDSISESWKQFSALERFDVANNKSIESVAITVILPDKLPEIGNLVIYMVEDGEKTVWHRISLKKLKKKDRNPQVYVDQILRKDNDVSVIGWAASDKDVEIEAFTKDGKSLSGQYRRFPRADVQLAFPECELAGKAGFQLGFRDVKDEFDIKISAGGNNRVIHVPMKKNQIMGEKFRSDFEKGIRVLKDKGVKEFTLKVVKKLLKKNRAIEYSEWIKHNLITEEEQEIQKKYKFEYNPLISIVVPLYKTPENFLIELIDSIKSQTYPNWELVLSDGSGMPSPLESKLKEIAEEDSRIVVIPADKPYKIVENTNRALKAAAGEYIAFGDHDDLFEPDALFECVKAINENKEIEMIYTDEDKIDERSNFYFEPQMKPDFNIDLLRTMNYICHLCVMKKELIDRIGFLRSEYEGAQDYDIILRAAENTKHIHHIPKVLYHWRSHLSSTADNPESKMYAFEAGRRAIQDHYNRVGIKAEVIRSEWPGLYRTRYIRDYDPLVSIMIPNKDHIDDLERCIDSILEKSNYQNYEIIIIENNSTEKETFDFYKKLEKKDKRIRTVYYEGDFNFSRINNFGAKEAKGEYLLLLNNDTSMINGEAIEEMLGYCMRDDVGIVGALLYFEDDTVQHAGVVVGFGGVAGHCFVMQPRGITGYCHRIISAQDYSAVTAACMMVKRSVYDEVGGLNEDFKVAFNDIDFCLKVREAGYLVVYNPYAELYHYESKSRGLEDSPEKISRFNSEIALFQERWPEILEKGDPYYNPNLTLDSQDFSLKKNY